MSDVGAWNRKDVDRNGSVRFRYFQGKDTRSRTYQVLASDLLIRQFESDSFDTPPISYFAFLSCFSSRGQV